MEQAVEAALSEKPLRMVEIARKLGVSRAEVMRGISALRSKNRIAVELIDGKPHYGLRTLENSLQELEKNKRIIQGEWSVVRVPDELYGLVVDRFKRGWDTSHLEAAVGGKKYQDMTSAEKIGYHLGSASTEFQVMVMNLVEAQVLDRLTEKDRELFKGYVEWIKGRRYGGFEGRTSEAAEKIANRVAALTQIEVERLGARDTILQVLGDLVENVRFSEALRSVFQRNNGMTDERLNVFAKEFLKTYNDERYYLVYPNGQSRFLDLIDTLGVDWSKVDLRINLPDMFIHATNLILLEIDRRKGDLAPYLRPQLKKALEIREMYVSFLTSREKQAWRAD